MGRVSWVPAKKRLELKQINLRLGGVAKDSYLQSPPPGSNVWKAVWRGWCLEKQVGVVEQARPKNRAKPKVLTQSLFQGNLPKTCDVTDHTLTQVLCFAIDPAYKHVGLCSGEGGNGCQHVLI